MQEQRLFLIVGVPKGKKKGREKGREKEKKTLLKGNVSVEMIDQNDTFGDA